MNGSRLEVEVHIVTAQKSSLSNLKKAVKSAGVEIDNIVLSGYASAISTINSDEKELGVCVVDMGGATCDVVIHSGNSIRFNDFLGVGSNNITNDLSMALHTPLPAAEKVKIDYGYMNSSSNELIELPILGDEQATHEVSLDIISNVIFARVEETLMILAKILEDSGYKDLVGAGVVLTGGLTKLEGIRELATSYFGNLPIRLARPREMEGLFETLRDPGHSTSIGLIMYGSGSFTPYEIDSNKKMRYKDEAIDPGKNVQKILEENDNLKLDKFEEIESPKEKLARIVEGNSSPKKGENVLIKFWHRLTQLF